jgi:hypothetical protein
MSAKFALGQLVATTGALEVLDRRTIMRSIARHLNGDWGDLDAHDRKANEDALKHGARLLSAYRSDSGTKFWIITEADRSATTILLPSEY